MKNVLPKVNLSYRKKVGLSLILITCILTAYTLILSYVVTNKRLFDSSVKLSENNLEYSYSIINNYFSTIQNAQTQLLRYEKIKDLSKMDKITEIDRFHYESIIDNQIVEFMQGVSANNAPIEYINMLYKNGFRYFKSNGVTESREVFFNYQACEQYMIEEGIITNDYFPLRLIGVYEGKNESLKMIHYILMVRGIYAPVTMERIGFVFTAIKEDELYESYSQISDSAFLITSEGTVISGKDKDRIMSKAYDDATIEQIFDSRNSSGTVSYKENSEIRIVSFHVFPSKEASFLVPFNYDVSVKSEEFYSQLVIFILIALTAVLIGLLLSRVLSNNLSSSIVALKSVVDELNNGNWDARYVPKHRYKDEISYFGENLNDMIENLLELFKQQEEESKINRNLEIRLMQSQINPHLLYNTLDSVLWAIQNESTHTAKSLIEALSGFFRITLSKGNSQIKLNDEIKIIRHYLDIQNIARNKQFKLDLRIDQCLLNYPIIKLSLQPFVENAIVHGFAGYADDGIILITSSVRENKLVISIEDNGIGMSENELELIQSELAIYPPKQNMKHFGMYNVNNRLKNTYGDGYGVRVDSQLGIYTRVTITIPYINQVLDCNN